MPRVLNAALAVFLLGCISPLFRTFSRHGHLVQAYLVAAVLPVLLVVALCLASAIRPGGLGRAVRRARARRHG